MEIRHSVKELLAKKESYAVDEIHSKLKYLRRNIYFHRGIDKILSDWIGRSKILDRREKIRNNFIKKQIIDKNKSNRKSLGTTAKK